MGPPRESVAKSLGITDAGDSSSEFFAKQNKKLQEENDKLRKRLDSQQAELDKLENFKIKHEAETERRENEDKFMGSAVVRQSKFGRQSVAAGKSRVSSIQTSSQLGSIGEASDGVTAKQKGQSSQSIARASKSAAPAPTVATAVAPTADARKVLDEFKKPLDDTRSLINEFAHGRAVPSVVSLYHVESMQHAIERLTTVSGGLHARVAALDARFDAGASRDREQRRRYDEASNALKHEQRRVNDELAALHEKFTSNRESALQRSMEELVKVTASYDRAYEDLSKPKGELPALETIALRCEKLSPVRYEEAEGGPPRQPPELGTGNNVRTMLSLAERADGASKVGGPLERLVKEAMTQAGPGCTMELAACKGFRRAMEKAQQEYSGDFLRLNDMARATIICPKFSVLSECMRWLIDDAAVWAKDEEALPHFAPLVCKDRLSPVFDAEAVGMYRYVLLLGRLTCDDGSPLNVEIQLHVKRLFEMRKSLSTLHSGRHALGALDPAVSTYEGELSRDAIARASKGIVTRLSCADSHERVSRDTVDALAAMLQASTCTLTELSLSGASGLDGVELGGGLLVPVAAAAGSAQLSCFRLRTVRLARLKLAGEIPKALAKCVWLQTLELHDNWLRGKIPDAMGKCVCLETLSLHGNALEGEVPADAIACLNKLSTLTLGGKAGGNEELWITAAGAAQIVAALGETEVYLPSTKEGGSESVEEATKAAEAAKLASTAARAAAEEAESAKRDMAHEAAMKRKEAARAVEAAGRTVKEAEDAKKAADQAKAAKEAEAKANAEADREATKEAERLLVEKVRAEVLDAAKARQVEETKKRKEEEARAKQQQDANKVAALEAKVRQLEQQAGLAAPSHRATGLPSQRAADPLAAIRRKSMQGKPKEPELSPPPPPEPSPRTQQALAEANKPKKSRSSRVSGFLGWGGGKKQEVSSPTPSLPSLSESQPAMSQRNSQPAALQRNSRPPPPAAGLTKAEAGEWGGGTTDEGRVRL